jgi:intracellular septation protein
MRLLLDIGPLILFFIANYKFGIFTATAAFIVAILIAMMVSLALTRRVTALQLFSAVMVVVMGGLTLYFHNETFIKIKPTIYYGLRRDDPRLRPARQQADPEVRARQCLSGARCRGWTKLTRNWALFFAVMAGGQ